jgi:hypothetical protein
MRPILIAHARRYPLWEADDLYKLIHQAAMGSEHALSDRGRARDSLRREIARLGPGPKEPLVDPISPDGEVVRVHLRPFAALQLSEAALLDAFIQTANHFPRSGERFDEYERVALQLAEEMVLAFPAKDLSVFMSGLRVSGLPAVHHSRRFEAEYAPAYRVVARELLPGELIAAARHL